MNRREELDTLVVPRGGLRICAKTFLTCEGSGSTVIVISYLKLVLASIGHEVYRKNLSIWRKVYQRIGFVVYIIKS